MGGPTHEILHILLVRDPNKQTNMPWSFLCAVDPNTFIIMLVTLFVQIVFLFPQVPK